MRWWKIRRTKSPSPLDGAIVKRHPQRLRSTFSPQEAESTLGVPDATTTDFGGGQHLTWLGTTHKLEASFNAGRLYCLALEDRATGHGVLVYDSPERGIPIESRRQPLAAGGPL